MFDLSNTQDYQYLLDSMGKDVTVNGAATPTRVIITNSNINSNFDDKYVSALSPLNRGDLIDYDGRKFMVISEESTKRYNKWKGLMRLLPHRIVINTSCQFSTVDCFISTSSLGMSTDRIISLPDGQIQVYLSSNSLRIQLKQTNRFLVEGQPFSIEGIDTFSKPGMVILTCVKGQLLSTDDQVNGIANGLACPVDITNTDPIVYVGETLQLNYTTTENAPVAFESSDTNIATVDDDGLVTGVSAGQATITISNASLGQINDTVIISVTEVPESLNVSITGSATVTKDYTQTYTANVYNGTTLITDGSQPVTWSLWDDTKTTTTTYATIQSQTGTNCVVKGVSSGFYVQLKATLNSDTSIFAWFRIQVKSFI